MQIFYPRMKCNSAHGIACWTYEQRVRGSNPYQVRIFYCLLL